jgi:hypothetical protein
MHGRPAKLFLKFLINLNRISYSHPCFLSV